MDRNEALALLRRSMSDIWAQASLRSLVSNGSSPTALARMSDDQVAEVVADLIASGRLVLVRTQAYGRRIDGEPLPPSPKLQAASAAPPPRPAPQPAAPPPPADAAVFPSNIDAAAQAAAMQQAAQQGAPFCLQ